MSYENIRDKNEVIIKNIFISFYLLVSIAIIDFKNDKLESLKMNNKYNIRY